MEFSIDVRVPQVTGLCPSSSRLRAGVIKLPSSGASDFVNASNLTFPLDNAVSCGLKAGKILKLYNETLHSIVSGSPEYEDLSAEHKAWLDHLNMFSSALHHNNNPNTPLEAVYWTWYNDQASAPFAKQCHITFNCESTAITPGNVVSSAVSGREDKAGDYAGTACTIPIHTTQSYTCALNKYTNKHPDECTGITSVGGEFTACQAWWSNVPDTGAVLNKDNVKNSIICEPYTWIDECVCLQRENDPNFMDVKNTKIFGAAHDVCWFRGCKNEGLDRHRLSTMENIPCDLNVCANFVNIEDSLTISMDQALLVASCTTDGSNAQEDILDIISDGQAGVSKLGGMTKKTAIISGVGVLFLIIIIVVMVRMGIMSKLLKKKNEKKT